MYGLAAFDPNPTRLSDIRQSKGLLHWTWTGKRKNQSPHLILHRGDDRTCKRKHHYKDGTPA
jgi:hypothetical protein